ncbi:MAG: glycosyltransferase, partial [Oligoflexia bacterium]|nr:glycosyltransferase [Oligoflexia bacterium]
MKKCLYYVYVWPEPLSSAAGLRCEQMITCLKQNGYEVELASPCTKNIIYESLIKKEYICHSVDPNNSETFQNLTKKDYQLILFDRYILEEQFGWRSRELWPSAIQIIDTQDLHSLRKNREDLLSKTYEESIEYDPEKQILDLHNHKDFTREIASILRADAALLLSTYEYSLLNEISIFPKNHLFYLPLSTPVEEDFPKFEDRSGLVFFGNFRHPPNLDAFRWLENKIYPALRRNIPEIPITVFGAYPPQEVSQVQKKLGIKFLGPIQNHRVILKQTLICIAPLRYGA